MHFENLDLPGNATKGIISPEYRLDISEEDWITQVMCEYRSSLHLICIVGPEVCWSIASVSTNRAPLQLTKSPFKDLKDVLHRYRSLSIYL